MGSINSVVDSNNVIDYCKELRLTANVDGKIHDNTTPHRVLEIPIRIINPSLDSTVFNYFNGESGLEIVLNEFLGLNNEEGYKLKYYGQEINKEGYAIGELINFLMTGNKDRIKLGDSLSNPAFIKEDELMKFEGAGWHFELPDLYIKAKRNVSMFRQC